jgi:hypothetical protein
LGNLNSKILKTKKNAITLRLRFNRTTKMEELAFTKDTLRA